MSDKDLKSNKEHLERQEREGFDYTLKDKADEIGIIAKGSAANSGNTSLTDKKKEEKKFYEQLLKAILSTPEEVDALLGEMDEAASKARKAVDRAKEYKTAYESGNLEQLIIMLKEDGHDVEGLKTPQDILDAAKEQYETEVRNARDNIKFVKDSNTKIQNSEVGTDEQKQDSLDSLETAEDLESELDSLGTLHPPKLDETTEFQSKHMEVVDDEFSSSSNLSLENNESNDPFACTFEDVGNGDQRQAASFASEVGDDPFAVTAESITDPFNEVAKDALSNDADMELTKKSVEIASTPNAPIL